MTSTVHQRNGLTSDQVRQFDREGYLAPLVACSPGKMDAYREYCGRLIASDSGSRRPEHNRHLDDVVVWQMCTLLPIIISLRSLLGDDLLLWRTNFFNKEPGGKEIPWHQDRAFWALEPEIAISVWLAIDRADVENCCVQVIPGTHRQVIPHVPAGKEMGLSEEADTSSVDLTTAVDVVLQPGEFLLFNERTLHHSPPNRSSRRRMGLSIRVIPPRVRVLRFDSSSHRLLQLSGTDPVGFNRLGRPPTGSAVGAVPNERR